MPAADPSEAKIARALRAAEREGWEVVEIQGNRIRFLAKKEDVPVTSPETEVNPWDAKLKMVT